MVIICSLLLKQISRHKAGSPEAILVVSLNPHAAKASVTGYSTSTADAACPKAAAAKWGKWLMAATTRSCVWGSKNSGLAPIPFTKSSIAANA